MPLLKGASTLLVGVLIFGLFKEPILVDAVPTRNLSLAFWDAVVASGFDISALFRPLELFFFSTFLVDFASLDILDLSSLEFVFLAPLVCTFESLAFSLFVSVFSTFALLALLCNEDVSSSFLAGDDAADAEDLLAGTSRGKAFATARAFALARGVRSCDARG